MANSTSKPMKRSSNAMKSDSAAKKRKVTTSDNDCEVMAIHRSVVPQYEWADYRYYPVDEEWQIRTCDLLGLQFVHPFQRQDGGPHVILTRPDLRTLKSIAGDGNCMFRALSYIISGSETQHFDLRSAIIAHMLSIPDLVSGIGPDGRRNYLVTYDEGYSSIEDYLVKSRMADNGTWGGDFELCVLAHLLNTPVYSFQGGHDNYWLACFPHGIDRRIPETVTVPSLYIYLQTSHFQVVTSIRRRHTA